MNLILQRLDGTSTEMLGAFTTPENKEICKALELPWRDNHADLSCIPAGVYTCRRRYSDKHKCVVFEVTGVPGRGDIEIHIANYARQLLGCVATGESFADLDSDGNIDVASSGAAFARFMALQDGVDEFTLDVRDPVPPTSAETV